MSELVMDANIVAAWKLAPNSAMNSLTVPEFKLLCEYALKGLAVQSESTAPSESYPGIAHDLETMRTALLEIAKGEGAFSRDPLTHAGNTIDAMKKLATDALRGVK